MLIAVLAHAGAPVEPHDLWSAWSADPLVVLGLLGVAALYLRGRRRGPRRDARLALGLVAVGVALLSPLNGVASALASAHMVQHVLLILVAAPLLASSAAVPALMRGMPVRARGVIARARIRTGLTPRRLAAVRHPLPIAALHAAVIWLWHSPVLYDAAVRHTPLHAVEHGSFLLTALLFWAAVLPQRRSRDAGGAILLVFAVAMQGVILSALMTFARAPWYASYRASAPAWGLDALADQQLAGVIMWVPAGIIYVAVAMGLVASWLAEAERETPPERHRNAEPAPG